MSSLKSEKMFPFRSFAGREPTASELRDEMERMYLYLVKAVDKAIDKSASELAAQIPDE